MEAPLLETSCSLEEEEGNVSETVLAYSHEDSGEDVSDTSVPECSICREELGPDDDTVTPCSCTFPKHRACLEEWINMGNRNVCEICKQPYQFRIEVREDPLCGVYLSSCGVASYTLLMVIGTIILVVGYDGWSKIFTNGTLVFIAVSFGIAVSCIINSMKIQIRDMASWKNVNTLVLPAFWTGILVLTAVSMGVGMVIRKFIFKEKRVEYWRFLNFIVGISMVAGIALSLLVLTVIVVYIILAINYAIKYDYRNACHQCFYRRTEIRVLVNETEESELDLV